VVEAPKKMKAAAPVKPTGMAHRVLVRPLLSEKTVRQEAIGTYTFVVNKAATKPAIKEAVEKVYGVRPVNVRVAHVDGKDVRFGSSQGRRNEWKKAFVTLPKGKTISIHEGV
jgi:large subunit ribosomal protein L23